jgi:hypothetical protein
MLISRLPLNLQIGLAASRGSKSQMSNYLHTAGATNAAFGFFLVLTVPVTGQVRELPSTPDFMDVLALCGAGSGIKIEADLRGSITSLYEQQKTEGKAIQDIVAKIIELMPSDQRLAAYTAYLGCVNTVLIPSPRKTLEGGPVTLQPGETRAFNIDLSRSGFVDVSVRSIAPNWTGREPQQRQWIEEGRGNTPELWFNICSAVQEDKCPEGVQRGINRPVRRALPSGPAAVMFYNFRSNPTVEFSPAITHP